MQATFRLHNEVSRVAAKLGLDARVMISDMQQQKPAMQMVVSQGPLQCLGSPYKLLQADAATLLSTEAAYTAAVVSPPSHQMQDMHQDACVC